MMPIDIMIFGASRQTGLLIAQIAHQHGYSIAAMVRKQSNQTALQALNVSIIEGDAFSLSDCENVLQQYHPKIIISTLGGKNKNGRRIDAIGNINVIQALLNQQYSPSRFVLVTSMGCAEQINHLSEEAQTALTEALMAKTKAEQFLQNTDLIWTIVRPCGLNNDCPKNHYSILFEPDLTKNTYLSRHDAAQAIFTISQDKQLIHQIVTIQS